MKKIKLRSKQHLNMYALVDDSDFEWLNQWKWNYHYSLKRGYGYAINEKTGETRKQMHRLINNTPEGFETDHINHNTLDNRRENLRTVTNSQNQQNRGLDRNNKSGYKGVSWDTLRSKWGAYIQADNRSYYLGLYSTIQGAWLARRWGERLHWGKPQTSSPSTPNVAQGNNPSEKCKHEHVNYHGVVIKGDIYDLCEDCGKALVEPREDRKGKK